MRNYNQYRKDLRKMVWAENALNCLENSINLSNLNAQTDTSLDLTKILEKADEIQECTKEMLTDEVGRAQRAGLEFKMIHESEQALSSLRTLLKKQLNNPNNKKVFENMDMTDLDSALNIDPFEYGLNLKAQNQINNYQSVLSNKSKKTEENAGTNYSIISRVIFGPSSFTLKPNKHVPIDPNSADKILLNSVKEFLFAQNSFLFSNFPFVNKSQLQLDTSVLTPENNKLYLLLQETNLLPSVQAVSSLLRKNRLKEDQTLNNDPTAKKIAALIGDIECAFSCIDISLRNSNKPHLIASVLSHYFVDINAKINELDLQTVKAMSSIDKQFDQHITNFLQVFSEVYLFFIRIAHYSLPKVIIECQSQKYFVNEAIRLKIQQDDISKLVGQMLNNLKKILQAYFKSNIEKVIKKDSFCIKAGPTEKNQLDSNSIDDLFGALNLRKTEFSTHFLEIFSLLNDVLAKMNCTEKWRVLVPQTNLDLQDSCQKMELLLKFHVIGSFLESIPKVFETKKFSLNFPGIVVFTINFFEQLNKMFGAKNKNVELLCKIPEFENYKNFLWALMSNAPKEREPKQHSQVKNTDFSWTKSIKSGKFSQPDWMNGETILKLLLSPLKD